MGRFPPAPARRRRSWCWSTTARRRLRAIVSSADVGQYFSHMSTYVLLVATSSFSGLSTRPVRTNPYLGAWFPADRQHEYGAAPFLASAPMDCSIATSTNWPAPHPRPHSIYDLAHESRGGLVAFRGAPWIEAVPAGTRLPPHRLHARRLIDPAKALSPRRKSGARSVAPSWVRRLSVHPYWQPGSRARAWFSKSMPLKEMQQLLALQGHQHQLEAGAHHAAGGRPRDRPATGADDGALPRRRLERRLSPGRLILGRPSSMARLSPQHRWLTAPCR